LFEGDDFSMRFAHSLVGALPDQVPSLVDQDRAYAWIRVGPVLDGELDGSP
jgi:hypothetical protein